MGAITGTLLNIDGGIIRSARVYTDAMDFRLAPSLEAALPGCPFHRDALAQALGTDGPAGDLLKLLERCL